MDPKVQAAGLIAVARIQLHNQGPVEFAAVDSWSLQSAVAGWCRENWRERRQAEPQLAASAPDDDAEAISEYFHEASEILERSVVEISPLADPTLLSEQQLTDTYNTLEALVLVLIAQRASVGHAILRHIEARQASAAETQLSAEDE